MNTKSLLTLLTILLFFSISFAASKLSFLSYYEPSSSNVIVKTDKNNNFYIITLNKFGILTIRAFDKNRNLLWTKDILPDSNALKNILASKGADFNGLIDLTSFTLNSSQSKTSGTYTYTTEVSTTCGYTDSSGNFQFDPVIIPWDVKVKGDYLYIVARTCEPGYKIVGGNKFSYVYLYQTSSSSYTKSFGFNKNIILFKLSVKDGSIAYSSYFGAYADFEGRALDIDQSGNIYITGYTGYYHPNDGNPYSGGSYTDSIIPTLSTSVLSYSAPTLNSAPTSKGCSTNKYENPFVIKLIPNGNTYTLSKIRIFGSYCIDRAFDVAVDKNGNVFIAGETYAGGDNDYTNFKLGSTALITRKISNPSTSGVDGFVVQFDSSLSAKSAFMFGSNGNDDVFGGIDTDDNGNVYIVGNASNGDLPLVQNKFTASQTYGSCYVIKYLPPALSTSPVNILFSTYIDPQVGVTSQTGGQCRDMEVSPDGKIYIVGTSINATGEDSAFIYIMDGSNQNTLHVERVSGSGNDDALSVSLDNIGNAFFAGKTTSQNLSEINPLTNFNSVDSTNGNTFIAKTIISKNSTAKTDDGKSINVSLTDGSVEDFYVVKNYPIPPANVKVTYAVAFKAVLDSGKDSITVKLTFPSAIPSNAKIYKIVNKQYIDITNEVKISGNTAEFTVKDNSKYDSNPAKGIIEDPVALAQASTSPANNGSAGNSGSSSSGGGGGGGCNFGSGSSLLISMLIPTLIYIRRRLTS